MNLTPSAFRWAIASLKPDDLVKLSHTNRPFLKRALAAIQPAKDQRDTCGLEIGCWKGDTTTWLLENGIHHITAIDTFAGSPELGPQELLKDFHTSTAPWRHQITVLQGRSGTILPTLTPGFDFIYIDGSHDSCDVILDAAYSFALLNSGGIMVFDDFQWNYHDDPYRNPGPAIQFFLAAWADQLTVTETGYQIAIRKNLHHPPHKLAHINEPNHVRRSIRDRQP